MIHLKDDPRLETLTTRLEIGFDSANNWQTAKATFTDQTLQINGHPVMEDWETPYMKELADIATAKGGVILEVGFGMGISAGFVQSSPIEKHLIIEANHDVFHNLIAFAKTARYPVEPIFGLWQETIGSIASESIDGILFDTYPLSAEEIHCNHFPFFQHAYRILKPGGIFTYYSDEVKDFSDIHRKHVNQAGFIHLEHKVCAVDPPADCQYWKSKTIMAPRLIK